MTRANPRRTAAAATLHLVLGDHLHDDPLVDAGFNAAHDRVVMIEAPGEATHVWSHRARITLFLAAMRHAAAEFKRRDVPLTYIELDDPRFDETPTLVGRLERVFDDSGVQRLAMIEAGEWRLEQDIRALCERRGIALVVRPDPHFLCTREHFADWAKGKRELRMEYFYRWMRKREHLLMDNDGEPLGGRWNFDAENRSGYPRGGPGLITPPARFDPDETTLAVIKLVESKFPEHPGSLEDFAWPVTRAQARTALQEFVEHRLPTFGRYQDAMWTDTPFGWHALLSTSLNLKLLDPREVVAASVAAWRKRGATDAELPSLEGFVRQVIGWREFIRGVYWRDMPGMARANHFGHERALPRWYWTADTRMNCMRACVGQTLRYGYAHHIQRLMVTGQFALLAQVEPKQVSDWYLAVYVDAVEWVELPNVVGMALFADGGRFTSKPYVASGQYIKRMSNYCTGCAYKPEQRTGPQACPVTVLFWAFLDRHEKSLAANPRTTLMARNVTRLAPAERAAVRRQAAQMLDQLDAL